MLMLEKLMQSLLDMNAARFEMCMCPMALSLCKSVSHPVSHPVKAEFLSLLLSGS
jgi:hypothetical protein